MRLPPNYEAKVELAKDYPAANTAAVITIAASEKEAWSLKGIEWSYDGTPTGGRLTVAIDGTTYLDLDITTGGPGQLEFPEGFSRSTKNEEVVITLAAGGAGVTGKLTTQYQ